MIKLLIALDMIPHFEICTGNLILPGGRHDAQRPRAEIQVMHRLFPDISRPEGLSWNKRKMVVSAFAWQKCGPVKTQLGFP